MNPYISDLLLPKKLPPEANAILDPEKEDSIDFTSLAIPSIRHHSWLRTRYDLVCIALAKNLETAASEAIHVEQLKQQLIAALVMATILEKIYREQLNAHTDVKKMREDMEAHQYNLSMLGVQMGNDLPSNQINLGYQITGQIRSKTRVYNIYRLTAARIKRVLDVVNALPLHSQGYSDFIYYLDLFGNPLFAHLGWFVYVPRAGTNAALFFIHFYPGFWMSDEEKKAGYKARFWAQLERRWFQMGNDVVWLAGNLLLCTFFARHLTYLAPYISLTLFGYDVLLAVILSSIEFYRLINLSLHYHKLSKQTTNPVDQALIKDYQQAINAQFIFEILRFVLNMYNTVGLFVGICLTLPPLLAINPAIPVIGAAILLFVTVSSYKLAQELDRYKPATTVKKCESLSRLGLFPETKPIPPITPDTNDLEYLAADFSS